MNRQKASRIGGRTAFKTCLFGLGAAYLMMMAIVAQEIGPMALVWPLEFEISINLCIWLGAAGCLGTAWLLGRVSGIAIFKLPFTAFLLGPLTAYVTVLGGTAVGSFSSFCFLGIPAYGLNTGTFEDFLMTPFLMVSIYGFFPTLAFGLVYGVWLMKLVHEKASAVGNEKIQGIEESEKLDNSGSNYDDEGS